MKGKQNNKLGEGERLVRLGQDRLAIKWKRAETMNVVLPAPKSYDKKYENGIIVKISKKGF